MVLLAWAVVGVVLCVVAAAILGTSAALLTGGVRRGRKLLIVAASLFPFICFGWAGAVFAFQAIVNESYLHRDAGLGDRWKCPLPDSYALLMIDTPDEGFVYNAKTQPGSGVGEQDDAIAGVLALQLSGRYILGGTNSHFGMGNDAKKVDSYFVLDMESGTHQTFADRASFEQKARGLGIALNLEPIGDVYRRLRFTWFDKLAAVLFFIPQLVGFGLLLCWVAIVRKRRSEGIPSNPTSR